MALPATPNKPWWHDEQAQRSDAAWKDAALAGANYDKTLTLLFSGAVVSIVAIADQNLKVGIHPLVYLLLIISMVGVALSVRLLWLLQKRALLAFYTQLDYEVIVAIIQPGLVVNAGGHSFASYFVSVALEMGVPHALANVTGVSHPLQPHEVQSLERIISNCRTRIGNV